MLYGERYDRALKRVSAALGALRIRAADARRLDNNGHADDAEAGLERAIVRAEDAAEALEKALADTDKLRAASKKKK